MATRYTPYCIVHDQQMIYSSLTSHQKSLDESKDTLALMTLKHFTLMTTQRSRSNKVRVTVVTRSKCHVTQPRDRQLLTLAARRRRKRL